MVLDKLPLHKYYKRVIQQLNDSLDIPKDIKEITLFPDIYLCNLHSQVTIIFKLDSIREVSCDYFKPVNNGPDTITNYHLTLRRVRYVYEEYTRKFEPPKGTKYYYHIRHDNFVTQEIGKNIHDGFVKIHKYLETHLNKRIA